MKNVTISTDEETLRWVRVEAAKAGRSVSAWLGERLRKERMADDGRAADIAAIKSILATPLGPMSEDGKVYIDRDEIYAERFRRFDHDDLLARHDASRKATASGGVADSAARFEQPGPKPSSSD